MNRAALLLLTLLAATAWAAPREVVVKELPLAGNLADRNPEFSGLAWWDDTLVLLPENAYDELYGIARDDLVQAVDADDPAPVETTAIPLDLNGALDEIDFVDGFEAILFVDDKVYFLLETRRGAWILSGTADRETGIVLDPRGAIELPLRTRLPNTTAEAITWHDGALIAFHEANGASVLEDPCAFRWTPGETTVTPIPSPPLEYRVTDATLPDDAGRFWVANYLYPGDARMLNPGKDKLAEEHGLGATHAVSKQVERLVEIVVDETGVKLTDTPPLQLQLDDSTGRNWEGLARLGDMGFVIVTDRFPRTILGFVHD